MEAALRDHQCPPNESSTKGLPDLRACIVYEPDNARVVRCQDEKLHYYYKVLDYNKIFKACHEHGRDTSSRTSAQTFFLEGSVERSRMSSGNTDLRNRIDRQRANTADAQAARRTDDAEFDRLFREAQQVSAEQERQDRIRRKEAEDRAARAAEEARKRQAEIDRATAERDFLNARGQFCVSARDDRNKVEACRQVCDIVTDDQHKARSWLENCMQQCGNAGAIGGACFEIDPGAKSAYLSAVRRNAAPWIILPDD